MEDYVPGVSRASFRQAAARLRSCPPRGPLATAYWAAVRDAVEGRYRPFAMRKRNELQVYNRTYEEVLLNGPTPRARTGDSMDVTMDGHVYRAVCSPALLDGKCVRFCIIYRPDGWGHALPGSISTVVTEG